MRERFVNLCMLEWSTEGKSEIFIKLIRTIFKKYGGRGEISPYLFNMANGDFKKNFMAGGIVTKDISVLLDYIPSKNILQIRVVSNKTISDKEIMGFISSKFPECSNYQLA